MSLLVSDIEIKITTGSGCLKWKLKFNKFRKIFPHCHLVGLVQERVHENLSPKNNISLVNHNRARENSDKRL